MSASLYPNVPNLPGVPTLLRQAEAYLPSQVTSFVDMLGLNQLLGGEQWGIFSGASPVLTVDSVLEVSLARDFDVPDFPLENGSFASYNKVARPYEARITVAASTSAAMRQDVLAILDSLVADTNLYSVVTPDRVYNNANVVHYDYERTRRQGTTLLIARIWVREIRTVATAVYSNTQSVNGASVQTTGFVQGTKPTGFLSKIEDSFSLSTGSIEKFL